jgi:acetylornithine deacetylase
MRAMSERRCIEYLRDYVAIPSVNPMGRSDIGSDIAGERRYAEHVREQLRRLGIDAEIVGRDDRLSVVGEARVVGATETLMVASHLDTVPTDRMEIDPFDPRIEAGQLFGRGSCDTKAGMAALIDALEDVLSRNTLRRNVIVVGEADEELGSIGVADVLESLDTRPDWVIATEPTGLRVVPWHKGIAIATLVARGRACHSSDPAAGSNAITALARAVLALDELGTELEGHIDPQLGPATCSVGLVRGGSAPNIVPDEARLVMDRRLLPGEDAEVVRAQIAGALERHRVKDVEIESVSVEKIPLSTPEDDPSVVRTKRALASAGLSTEPLGVAFGTDAGPFSLAGIPGVVLGPGSISMAHTSRECVPTREVEQMADVFVRLLEDPGN